MLIMGSLCSISFSFLSSKTTIPELFAVMRQWVPQIQRNMASLTREVRLVLQLKMWSCLVDGVYS